jgi:predicted dehydrogenase
VRYSALYVTVGELIKSGAIGEPFHIRCIRAGGNTPDKGWSPGATWFVSKAAQGGLILDIGIHMADMMEWVMGGEVEKIAALVDTRSKDIDVPDNVSALFRFANGATGILELSWTMPSGAGILEIYGTKGRIRQGATEKPIELTRIVDGKPEVTFPEQKTGVTNSFAAFADAIKGVAPSPTSGEMGRNALALCDAIAKSGGTGRFVKVQKFAR